MNDNQANLPSAPQQPSGVDPDNVRQGETTIVACLTRNDAEAAGWTCRQLYTSAAGRYCMAALGDTAASNRVLLDVWSRLPDELKTADLTRTMRSVVLGLVRRRCAYAEEMHAPMVTPPEASTMQTLGASSSRKARALLARLRPSDRDTLILKYVCGLSHAEIGSIWGIEEPEARLRVSNALAAATRLSEVPGLG